jgi:polysaccharide deacetylase 2 family uncharacterized protein YibQ
MLRREFLRHGTAALIGSLAGLGRVYAALAGPSAVGAAGKRPQLALVIDDIGYSRAHARRFLSLKVPITFAILPRLRRSKSLAAEIYDNRQEVMLHQPMEPFNSRLNPGPGALFVGARPDTVAAIIAKNLDAVPHVSGVNNHMGSRFTSSSADISCALAAIRDSGLYFVDSVTTGRSLAHQIARGLAVTTARRNIFLDNRASDASVHAQLLRLKAHAQRHGRSLGIGHPHSATAEGIRRFVSDPANGDIALVHVSRLLGGTNKSRDTTDGATGSSRSGPERLF